MNDPCINRRCSGEMVRRPDMELGIVKEAWACTKCHCTKRKVRSLTKADLARNPIKYDSGAWQ